MIYFRKGDDKRILNMICGRQGLSKNKYKDKNKDKYKDKYKNNRQTYDVIYFGKEMTEGVRLSRICRIYEICKICKQFLNLV